MRAKMPLVLLEDDWLGLLSPDPVSKGCLDKDLVKHGTVVKGDGKRVGDGTELLVVVIAGHLLVLDAGDLLAEALNERRGGGLSTVSVVGGLETSVNKHDRGHVLDAVITVGKVVHGLELLVDNADACLVGAAGDLLDVGGGLAHRLELVVDSLGGLNRGLRVELGYYRVSS